jgi:hypothetical protein
MGLSLRPFKCLSFVAACERLPSGGGRRSAPVEKLRGWF